VISATTSAVLEVIKGDLVATAGMAGRRVKGIKKVAFVVQKHL
jgi:hypothetical protein